MRCDGTMCFEKMVGRRRSGCTLDGILACRIKGEGEEAIAFKRRREAIG